MNKQKNFYVVFKGHNPGIYDEHQKFTAQIKGFKNPSMKKYKSFVEAQTAFDDFNKDKNRKIISLNNKATETKKGFRASMPEHWEDFITCIVLHMLIPLVPLLLEFIVTNGISTRTLTLSAAIYSISISKTSSSKSQLALGIIISLIFAACYGITISNTEKEMGHLNNFATGAILLILIIHIVERYNKHILDREPFLTFKNK